MEHRLPSMPGGDRPVIPAGVLLLFLVAAMTVAAATGSKAIDAAKAANDVDADKLPALVLYVAPAGSDAWTGTRAGPNAGRTDGPFATLERARDELRQRRKAGTITDGAAGRGCLGLRLAAISRS